MRPLASSLVSESPKKSCVARELQICLLNDGLCCLLEFMKDNDDLEAEEKRSQRKSLGEFVSLDTIREQLIIPEL